MSSQPVERVVSLLTGCRRSGDGWSARCPAHEDSTASLSVREGADGKVLLHCFAGCSVSQIVEALGLATCDLFPERAPRPPDRIARQGITVNGLAEAKAIPADFLRSLGLRDLDRGVLIPYLAEEGAPVPRQRLRTALKAGAGSSWMPGDGPIVPYGLDRLATSRDGGFLILVEGESDSWTCWLHGFPALGIPGARMAKSIQSAHLVGRSKLYLIREPDDGGAAFVIDIVKRLRQLAWNGQVLEVRLQDAKDPNDLHKLNPGAFREAFRSALDRAVPLALDEPPPPAAMVGQDDWIEALLLDSGISLLRQDAPLPSIEAALRCLSERATGLDPLQIQVLREATIRRLTGCGVQASAKTFDAAIAAVAAGGSDGILQGRGLTLAPPEPAPEPVDGAQLLDELAATFRRFVALPDGGADAEALWIVHSYALEVAFASPLLALTSPEKRCGKTTNLEVLAALASCPLPASNITPAALFRAVERYRPTLLVDEADTFLATNDELRGVLNSGHTRTTAQVVRTVGDSHEPRIFSTWCPKVIALIGRLPGTLEDRSIVIPLRRRAAGESVERLRRDRLDDRLAPLRSRIARWVGDHLQALRNGDPEVPAELHDRAQDNWRPLLAIADLAGGDWPQRARQAALALTAGAASSDDSARAQLLSDIRGLFAGQGARFLPSEEIVQALVGLEERPWAEWGKGKPLTKNQLARLLRPFEVRPGVQREGPGTARGYTASDFEDAFARYLPPQPKQPEQPANDAGSSGFPNRNTEAGVSVVESGEKPRYPGVVTVVSVAPPPDVSGDSPGDKDRFVAEIGVPETIHGLGLTEAPNSATAPPDSRSSLDSGSVLPLPQCRSCHGSTFWTHADGRRICARCHPPVNGPSAANPASEHDAGGPR